MDTAVKLLLTSERGDAANLCTCRNKMSSKDTFQACSMCLGLRHALAAINNLMHSLLPLHGKEPLPKTGPPSLPKRSEWLEDRSGKPNREVCGYIRKNEEMQHKNLGVCLFLLENVYYLTRFKKNVPFGSVAASDRLLVQGSKRCHWKGKGHIELDGSRLMFLYITMALWMQLDKCREILSYTMQYVSVLEMCAFCMSLFYPCLFYCIFWFFVLISLFIFFLWLLGSSWCPESNCVGVREALILSYLCFKVLESGVSTPFVCGPPGHQYFKLFNIFLFLLTFNDVS